MSELNVELLDREIEYLGDGISVRDLETTIHSERRLQDDQVAELSDLRQRNREMQEALGGEMDRLRELSDHLQRERERGGVMSSLRDVFGRLPWFQGRVVTKNSIEQMLRAQYELSAVRVREAAEFADRLEVARVNLFDEIDRLNELIIQSAKNEEIAADHIDAVRDLKLKLELKQSMAEPESAEARQLQAYVDQSTRVIAKHAGLLKLYSTAENRLERLKENTGQLAETIAYLRNDIVLYVTAASEKIDVIAGQIQAIGAAADASVVMLELKHSLESLTEAVNHTSRFVTETQSYFRQNVDQMVDELELYDEETVLAFEQNLTFNNVYDELRGAESVSDSLAKEIDALAHQVREEVDLENKVVLQQKVQEEVQKS